MPICKFCQKPFAWGLSDSGKFVPLVPIGEDAELDRTYQDENGVLRAEHRNICVSMGGPTVRVARLVKSVPAQQILPAPEVLKETVGQTIDRIRARKKRKVKQ